MGIRGASGRTTPSTTAPSNITVGASPYIYQNPSGGLQTVLVTGGTVSLIEFSRDGATYYTVGLITGAFDLNPSDRLRVTYAVVPTMTAIQVT